MTDEQRRRWVVPPRSGTFRGLQLEYLDPDDPDERRILIEAEHPEFTDLGYDRHEVLQMLGRAVTTQVWRAMHEGQPFDLEGFRTDLAALPESWEEERSAPPS